MGGDTLTEPKYTPTPSEIRAECRNMQRGWTEEEERYHRRIRGDATHYEVPTVSEKVFGVQSADVKT